MSEDNVASNLGVAQEAVYTWITGKDMPSHKVGLPRKFQAS